MNPKRLPRTHEALRLLLENASCAGYFAGFRDREHGKELPKRQAALRRRQIRAELQRWMNQEGA